MKTISITLLSILLCLNAVSQTLSGNCVDTFNASIAYDPVTDGYLTTAFLPTFQGSQTASGDYIIYPAVGNSCNTLKKVIIIVEGFDLTNSRSAVANYAIFDSPSSNYAATTLRTMGYDIIVLNFTDAHNYIERNAYLLIELIRRVNNSKVTEDEITIIGASMGGLVGRYALSYMESNDIPHQCKLFATFDSPNKGAYLPLGVQFLLLDYHSNPITGPTNVSQWFGLMSPSASQLLRHHLISGTTPPTLNVNFTKFYNKLRTLNGCFGYPKNCKTLGISLGAMDGTFQKDNSGSPIVGGQPAFDYLLTTPIGNGQAGTIRTYPSPPIPSNGFVDICNNVGLFVNTNHLVQTKLSYEAAPGGYFNIFSDVADGIAESLSGASITKFCDKSSFIPTLSSIDYAETDLFYNISSDITAGTFNNKTPFDDVTSTGLSINEEHINNISATLASNVINRISTANNNVCGNSSLLLNNVNYSFNYYNKAQNTINLTNSTLNTSKIFDIYAGSEISVQNEVVISSGMEFRAYIKSCNAAKSCNYAGNSYRTINKLNTSLDFTSESYAEYYYSKIKNKELEPLQMYVAPNPNKGDFNLLFSKNVTGGKLKIINTLNQTIYSKNLENTISTNTYELNLSNKLVSGTYYILWNNDKSVISQKFIVE